MTKRLLAILTLLAMLLSFLPVSAEATENITLTVANNTYLTGDPAPPWTGVGHSQSALIVGTPTLLSATTDALTAANVRYTLDESGTYFTEINGIAEKDCGNMSGWMVSVNGWFPNVGADALYLRDGDTVSWQYSLDWGADLGSSWTSTDTTVGDLDLSAGTLKPAFSSDVFDYTLILPEGVEEVRLIPGATNKNNQTRIYKNATITDGVIAGESAYENQLSGLTAEYDIPDSLGYFRHGEAIAVTQGDVITVACGLPGWNGSPTPTASESPTENGCIYTFTIERPITVSVGVYDHTAVTYHSAAASVSGTVAEDAAYSAHTGMTALELFLDFFEDKNLTYSVNDPYSYIESVNGLAEFACGNESGWMFSVDDNFGNRGASATAVNDGERFELHYSVSGYGADVGSYFGDLPTVTEFQLAGTNVTLSKHTTYGGPPDYLSTTDYYLGTYVDGGVNTPLTGNGSQENPFIIPITVPYGTDLSNQFARVKTTLHPHYRAYEGVDPTVANDYSADLTFCLKATGGLHKTYYTVRAQIGSAPSVSPVPSGGSSSKPKELPIADLKDSMEKTGHFLLSNVPDPTVGSVGGEWTVFGLARSDLLVEDAYFRNYFDALFATLNEKDGILHERKYTEYARAVLVLSAVGRNPSRFSGYDLVMPLLDTEAVESQGLNGVIWALIALNACDDTCFSDPERVNAVKERYKERILESRLTDGGWSILEEDASSADADMTAMAIVALVPYKEDTVIRKAVKVLATLPATTAESLAWEVVALSEAGVPLNDSRFCVGDKTLFDRLLDYRTEDGFAHVSGGESNLMATEQCFYALVAANRSVNGEKKLFDLSDRRVVSRVAEKPIIATNTNFSDLNGCEMRTKVEALASRGIIRGRNETSFCPNDTLTRAELATLTVYALSLTRQEETPFLDLVPGAWYQDYVKIAVAHNLIYGTSTTTFEPDLAVTREQTALIFNRAATILELPTLFDTKIDSTPMTRAEAAGWLYDLLDEAGLL